MASSWHLTVWVVCVGTRSVWVMVACAGTLPPTLDGRFEFPFTCGPGAALAGLESLFPFSAGPAFEAALRLRPVAKVGPSRQPPLWSGFVFRALWHCFMSGFGQF